MGQIFLFTKGAKIGNETRKQLREAGIVPVEVENLGAVKLLDATAPEVHPGIILRAAMRAIKLCAGSSVNGYFAQALADELLKLPTTHTEKD